MQGQAGYQGFRGYLGDAATAERLHERASAMCFIARSVNFPIIHEPETGIAQTG